METVPKVKVGQRIQAMQTHKNRLFGIAGREGIIIRYIDYTHEGISSKLCTIRDSAGELFDCADHSLNILDPCFDKEDMKFSQEERSKTNIVNI